MKKHTETKVLFLSTYPPRACGIATFTQDIVRELKKDANTLPKVVAISNGGEVYDNDVLFDIPQSKARAYEKAAVKINASGADVLMVEHEYGIFGGANGEWLLRLMEQVSLPMMLTCHTVLPRPAKGQLATLSHACALSGGVVCMGKLSRLMLADIYGARPEKISVLHHGVPEARLPPREAAKAEAGLAGRFVVSTFGLVSAGKGLEYGIEAIASVAKKHPEVCYLILGATHPVVRQREGEAYRESLIALTEKLGAGGNVRFVNQYLEKPDILRYLALSDVYMTPYLGRDQAVSGTLAYAIGCGRVVVSTPYIYAREMLAEGRGLLAEFRDAASLAAGIELLITDPGLRLRMEHNTLRLGKTMAWPQVAAQYSALFSRMATQKEKDKVS